MEAAEISSKLNEYEVEIIYLSEPRFVVTIQDFTERDAIRRAINAVWWQQLRNDDPWDKTQMIGRIYVPDSDGKE